MTTQVCPKSLIFVNALFALAAIGFTVYKTPASFIYDQVLSPENIFNQRPIPEKINQSKDFREHGAGWGYGRYGRMYNVKTVETITGTVLNVDTFTPTSGMSKGVNLQVKTQKGTIPVHLGPAWYIENQEITIKPEDKVEIKGSKTNFARKPAIIAAEVKKGNMTLVLQDEYGFPVWNGWRRHQFN